MSLIQELKRRNVFRVAIAYAVTAWLLIQVAETIFPLFDFPDSAARTVVILAATLFFPTLIISWFFELTPGGFVRESDLDSEPPGLRHSGRRFDFAIIGVLSVALIYFVSTHEWNEQGGTGPFNFPEKSVAVLPFANLSGNLDNEYLSDGITETLLHALAQLPDLKVPARTSSFFFKGQNIDVREIAKKLGVSTILEGSIQRDGDTIRVVAQLTEAETGYRLWSKSYDRKMHDIFSVQDEIANNVAHAMKITLAGDTGQRIGKIETIGTNNIAAYDAYLKGLEQQNIRSNTSLLLAEISFDLAQAMDPDFYQARLELARTYFAQRLVGEITNTNMRMNVEPLLNQLRMERPDDIWVTIFDGRLRNLDSIGIEKLLIDLNAAIEQSPNEARLYKEMFNALRFLQRPEEALDWLNRGIEVDLLNWDLHLTRARLLERAGDLDGAEVEYAKTIELNPGNSVVHSLAANIHWERKEYGKAFAMERNAMTADPLDYELLADIASALYQFGLLGEGDKYLRRAKTSAPDKPYIQMISLYQLLLHDDPSQARDMSEKMLRDNIENRFYAYSFAAMVFMSVMTEFGESEEASTILEELYPEISSPEIRPDNGKDWALQYHAVLALAKTQSTEEALNLLDEVVTNWDESFPRWRNDPGAVAVIEMARGNADLAIELAIEDLEGRVSEKILLYRLIKPYKELAQEPAVAERLAELESEAKQAGYDLRAYIEANELQL